VAYDKNKLGELILYVALKCHADPNFGKVKLNKILFYADFNAYMKRGKSITEAVYKKREFGPCAHQFMPVVDTLEAAGRAAWQRASVGPHTQHRLVALEEPNLDLFAGGEVAIVDDVIEQLAGKTGTQISEESHELPGWRFAELGADIPYFTACLPTRPIPLTEKESAWMAQVVATL